MTDAQRNVCARSNHHLQCNELLWAQGRSDVAGAGAVVLRTQTFCKMLRA